MIPLTSTLLFFLLSLAPNSVRPQSDRAAMAGGSDARGRIHPTRTQAEQYVNMLRNCCVVLSICLR